MAVELGEDSVDNLQVTPLSPADVPGRVVIDGKQEVKGLETTRLTLTAADDVYQGVPMTTVKADGTFTLGGVTADRYMVNLTGMPENCYLKAAKFGDKTWNDGTVEIGAAAQPFTLVVGDDNATVTGVIQDEKGEAAPGTYAVLVDKARRGGRNKSARADEKGVFRVMGVDPGEYLAFAADDIDGGAIDDEEYVKPWLSKASSVAAAPGGQAAVNLKLQR